MIDRKVMPSILTFTTLYPNIIQSTHGVFVENRLRHLRKETNVKARVIAPIPWIPTHKGPFKNYPDYPAIPDTETRCGVEITHPRYLIIPKIGWYLTPWLLYQGTKKAVQALNAKQKIDLIDAHYLYPDGLAAALHAKDLGIPFTMTARGSDVNVIADHILARKMITWAAKRANHIITVSESLKEKLISHHIDRNKVTTLRNGVDLDTFTPQDQKKSRRKFNIPQNNKILLSVGNLIELKGHHLIIKALTMLDNTYQLYIAGSGPDETMLKKLIEKLNLQDRVHLLGKVPHDQLPILYSAADALILASSREGWPNVVLESIACGTPVIANTVNGTPEIIKSPEAGILIKNREAETIKQGIEQLFSNLPNRNDTANYAKAFTWTETSLGQERIFKEILAK